MIRHVLTRNLHASLLFALVLGALTLGAAALAPSPTAARYVEDTGRCEFGEMYHLPFIPGDSGHTVAHAQCLLNEHWGYDLAIDGEYGPETRDAVEDVQRIRDLAVDGVVNPCTWYAIHEDTQGFLANC